MFYANKHQHDAKSSSKKLSSINDCIKFQTVSHAIKNFIVHDAAVYATVVSVLDFRKKNATLTKIIFHY